MLRDLLLMERNTTTITTTKHYTLRSHNTGERNGADPTRASGKKDRAQLECENGQMVYKD